MALRRKIHQYPELGNDLPRTKAAVLEAIGDLDLQIEHSLSTSGLVVTLKGARPGPSILLRGDMDALPMTENTGLPFTSRNAGCMHACGHDSHAAMLATAARLLCLHREDLAGEVRFMFQPGEEDPGGALPMIEEGLLDRGGPPDGAFALHIYPNLPAGTIACRAGAVMAGADTVTIRINGKGGHGAMPYDALDPVPVACELVQAFQTFVTRRTKPFDPIVLTVGRIQAGTASNVIPAQAELDASLRFFSEHARAEAHAGIRRLARNIAAAHSMTAEIDVHTGYPATYNDTGFVELVVATASDLFGEAGYFAMPDPVMASEDFSYVLQRIPGAFAFLGAAPEGTDPANAPPCHSSHLALEESAMAAGIAMHAALAQEFLKGGPIQL